MSELCWIGDGRKVTGAAQPWLAELLSQAELQEYLPRASAWAAESGAVRNDLLEEDIAGEFIQSLALRRLEVRRLHRALAAPRRSQDCTARAGSPSLPSALSGLWNIVARYVNAECALLLEGVFKQWQNICSIKNMQRKMDKYQQCMDHADYSAKLHVEEAEAKLGEKLALVAKLKDDVAALHFGHSKLENICNMQRLQVKSRLLQLAGCLSPKMLVSWSLFLMQGTFHCWKSIHVEVVLYRVRSEKLQQYQDYSRELLLGQAAVQQVIRRMHRGLLVKDAFVIWKESMLPSLGLCLEIMRKVAAGDLRDCHSHVTSETAWAGQALGSEGHSDPTEEFSAFEVVHDKAGQGRIGNDHTVSPAEYAKSFSQRGVWCQHEATCTASLRKLRKGRPELVAATAASTMTRDQRSPLVRRSPLAPAVRQPASVRASGAPRAQIQSQ